MSAAGGEEATRPGEGRPLGATRGSRGSNWRCSGPPNLPWARSHAMCTRSAKCRLSWRSDSRRLSASLFIQWGRDTIVLRATARPDITFRRNEGVRIALRLRAGGDASEVADRVQNVSTTQGEPRGIARTPVDLYQPLTHCGSSACRQKSRAITNLGKLVNRFRFP